MREEGRKGKRKTEISRRETYRFSNVKGDRHPVPPCNIRIHSIAHHSAGVALILRDDVTIRCVEELDGGRAGRLVGAVIQTTVGNNILFVCAYMPTGMDRAADDGDKARKCHRIYDKIITWSNEAGRLTGGKVVMLGHFNETIRMLTVRLGHKVCDTLVLLPNSLVLISSIRTGRYTHTGDGHVQHRWTKGEWRGRGLTSF